MLNLNIIIRKDNYFSLLKDLKTRLDKKYEWYIFLKDCEDCLNILEININVKDKHAMEIIKMVLKEKLPDITYSINKTMDWKNVN